MTSLPLITIGPNGGLTRYSSLRKASRALSGDGSDGARRTISRRVLDGGGYVGDVWVQRSDIPTIKRTR